MNAPDRYVAFIMIVESTSPNALRSVVWSCGCVVAYRFGGMLAFTGVAQGAPAQGAPAQDALYAPAVRWKCASESKAGAA